MAKSQLRANLLMGLENTSTRMIRLAKNEIYYKKILNTNDIIHYIDSITIDDVMHVSEMITDNIDNMQISVIY
jgi:predicted Zn-dependent peptidase